MAGWGRAPDADDNEVEGFTHRVPPLFADFDGDGRQDLLHADPGSGVVLVYRGGERGAEVPVLCVELEQDQTWSAELEAELAKLADGSKWAGVVRRIVHHPGFPVDPRHNSKIKREELKLWATDRLPELAREAA